VDRIRFLEEKNIECASNDIVATIRLMNGHIPDDQEKGEMVLQHWNRCEDCKLRIAEMEGIKKEMVLRHNPKDDSWNYETPKTKLSQFPEERRERIISIIFAMKKAIRTQTHGMKYTSGEIRKAISATYQDLSEDETEYITKRTYNIIQAIERYTKMKKDPILYKKFRKMMNESRNKTRIKQREYMRKFRIENPEKFEKIKAKMNKASRSYYQRNKDKIKAYHEKWLENIKKDPEKYQEYLEKHKKYWRKIKSDPVEHEKAKKRLKEYVKNLKETNPLAYLKHYQKPSKTISGLKCNRCNAMLKTQSLGNTSKRRMVKCPYCSHSDFGINMEKVRIKREIPESIEQFAKYMEKIEKERNFDVPEKATFNFVEMVKKWNKEDD